MVGSKESNAKRHYKKDSRSVRELFNQIPCAAVSIRKIHFRYLLDLYTLTFDEDETVDEIKVQIEN